MLYGSPVKEQGIGKIFMVRGAVEAFTHSIDLLREHMPEYSPADSTNDEPSPSSNLRALHE